MKKRLPEISLIVSIIGVTLTIIGNIISKGSLNKLLILSISFFVSNLIIGVYIAIKLSRKIDFFVNRNSPPKLFDPNELLKFIKKKRCNLVVLGRTNFHWFNDDDENKMKLRLSLIKEALQSGSKITFIVQKRFYYFENLSRKQNDEIQKDLEATIEAYKYMISEINDEDLVTNFIMKFSKIEVENSMTMVSDLKGNVPYFFYDIGQNSEQKPFLIFKKSSVFSEIKNKLDTFVKDAELLQKYEGSVENAFEEISKTLSHFNHASNQRNNNSRKLVYNFIKSKLHGDKLQSPISVQLLITNKCTSNCIMCKHHEIDGNELTTQEIIEILKYIKNFGVKSIVFSGGEPLCRNDFIDIIRFAKSELGLNVGVLTNGVNSKIRPLAKSTVKEMCSLCDWIQVSVDSFDSETYSKIRKGADYEILKANLTMMESVSKDNNVKIEICYTIQHENIKEVEKILKDEIEIEFSSDIRFKFAHGPDNENKFLLNKERDLNTLKSILRNGKDKKRFNISYLKDMFFMKFFTYEDILSGNPVNALTRKFAEKKYKCFAIKYTCKIDSNGDVYPCCFLFDDNQGNDSNVRAKHKIGSLVDKNTDSIIPIEQLPSNPLQDLWIKINKRDNHIPLDENACINCTRYFYQNDLLNKIDGIVDNSTINDLYQHLISQEELIQDEKIWF